MPFHFFFLYKDFPLLKYKHYFFKGFVQQKMKRRGLKSLGGKE